MATSKEHVTFLFNTKKVEITPSYKYLPPNELDSIWNLKTFNYENTHWTLPRSNNSNLTKINMDTLGGSITFNDHFIVKINNKRLTIKNFEIQKVKGKFILFSNHNQIFNLNIVGHKLNTVLNHYECDCNINLTPYARSFFKTELNLIGNCMLFFCVTPEQEMKNHTFNPSNYILPSDGDDTTRYHTIDAVYINFFLHLDNVPGRVVDSDKLKTVAIKNETIRNRTNNLYNGKIGNSTIMSKSISNSVQDLRIQTNKGEYEILFSESKKTDTIEFENGFELQGSDFNLDFRKFKLRMKLDKALAQHSDIEFELIDIHGKTQFSFIAHSMYATCYNELGEPVSIDVNYCSLVPSNKLLNTIHIGGELAMRFILKPTDNNPDFYSLNKRVVEKWNLEHYGRETNSCPSASDGTHTEFTGNMPPVCPGNNQDCLMSEAVQSSNTDSISLPRPYKWTPQFVTIINDSYGSWDSIGDGFYTASSTSCNNQPYYLKNKYSRIVNWSQDRSAFNRNGETYYWLPCIFTHCFGKLYSNTAFEGFFMTQLAKGGGKSGFAVAPNSLGCAANNLSCQDADLEGRSQRGTCDDGCGCDGSDTISTYSCDISSGWGPESSSGSWLTLGTTDYYSTSLNTAGNAFREGVQAARGIFTRAVPSGTYVHENNSFLQDGSANGDDFQSEFASDSQFNKIEYWQRHYTLPNIPAYIPEEFLKKSRVSEGIGFEGGNPYNFKFMTQNIFARINGNNIMKGSICVLDLLWETLDTSNSTSNSFTGIPPINAIIDLDTTSQVYEIVPRTIVNPVTSVPMKVFDYYAERTIYFKDRLDNSTSTSDKIYSTINDNDNTNAMDFGVSDARQDTSGTTPKPILYSSTVVGCLRIASQAYEIEAPVNGLGGLWRYNYNIYNYDFDPKISKITIPIGSLDTTTDYAISHNNYISPNSFANADGKWVSEFDTFHKVLQFKAQNDDSDLVWESRSTNSNNLSQVPIGWDELASFSFKSTKRPIKGRVQLEHFKPLEMDWEMQDKFGVPASQEEGSSEIFPGSIYNNENKHILATESGNSVTDRQWYYIYLGAVVPEPNPLCDDDSVYDCYTNSCVSSTDTETIAYSYDCFGICGGTSEVNAAGICECIDLTNCFNFPTCNSDGDLFDSCGVCGGTNERDCAGLCSNTQASDDYPEYMTNEYSSETTRSIIDCAGLCTIIANASPIDCLGVCNGSAEFDSCAICTDASEIFPTNETDVFGCVYRPDISYPFDYNYTMTSQNEIIREMSTREFTWGEIKLDQENNYRKFMILQVDSANPGILPVGDIESSVYQVWGLSERFRSKNTDHGGGSFNSLESNTFNNNIKYIANSGFNSRHSPREGAIGYPTSESRGYAFCDSCSPISGDGLCNYSTTSYYLDDTQCPSIWTDSTLAVDIIKTQFDDLMPDSSVVSLNSVDGRVPWYFCHLIDIGYGSIYDSDGGACTGNVKTPNTFLGTIEFVKDEARQDIKIPVGWSLFSTYIEENNNGTDALTWDSKFQDKEIIVKDYDGSTYTSKSYLKKQGFGEVESINNLTDTNIKSGKGYWIFSTEEFILTIKGDYNPIIQTNYNRKWHIISFSSFGTKKLTSLIDYRGQINIPGLTLSNSSIIFIEDSEGKIFNNGQSSGNTLEYLVPGRGYTVHTMSTE